VESELLDALHSFHGLMRLKHTQIPAVSISIVLIEMVPAFPMYVFCVQLNYTEKKFKWNLYQVKVGQFYLQ
jgi:hypothetical protein